MQTSIRHGGRKFPGLLAACGLATVMVVGAPTVANAQNYYYGYAHCTPPNYPSTHSTGTGSVKHQIAFEGSADYGYLEKNWQNGGTRLTRIFKFGNTRADWATLALSDTASYRFWGCSAWGTTP